jgi:dGTP triphosphohydrolase
MPDFINHYVDQDISDACNERLFELGKQYHKEKSELEKSSTSRNTGDYLYKQLTGKNAPVTYNDELNQLTESYKQKALSIAKEEAQKEAMDVKEWKEPEQKKTVEQKSKETDDNLKTIQESLLKKIESQKQKNRSHGLGLDR